VADGEEITSEEEDAWYLRRLESGLFTLQTVDYILAWIAMEDDGVRTCSRLLDPLQRLMDDYTRSARIYCKCWTAKACPCRT
jgi:beta-catenin-like protein 1